MQHRVKQLSGVRNFRDFGGYASKLGGAVQQGRLFRSGHFANTETPDAETLDALNITVQADLRRPDERERMRGVWPKPEAGVTIITSDIGREADAPHAQFLQAVEADADKAFAWMRDYYVNAPYKPQHIEHFTTWFEELAALENGRAALVNCAAGKDRTGILCMLTHHVLGVSDADIMTDYLLTNEASDVTGRLPEMAKIFNERLGKNYAPEIYKPFMGVDAEFLQTAIKVITEKSGSIDAYIANDLKISNAHLTLIRTNLLAG